MDNAKKIKAFTGRIAFWLSWPILYWYLRKSERTRVLMVWQGKVLLVKGWLSAGKWSVPGGGLHQGEEPITGAIREVAEETGIQLSPQQLISFGTAVCKEFGFMFTCHQFLVLLDSCPATELDTSEIITAEWAEIDSLTIHTTEQAVLNLRDNWLAHQLSGKI